MIPANETFNGTYPFKPNFTSAPGFRMHYVDEGHGEPIVCLHGEPTWGYIYRKFIPSLSRSHRVIVPDHMGFGKSETPADREYTLRTHVDNLEALLLGLNLADITLVMQDWGGPIGGGFACRHPDRVKRLCLLNTIVPLGLPLEPALFPKNMESEWFRWIRKSHDDGSLENVLGHLDVTVLSVMKLLGFENSAAVDQTWIQAYGAHFRTKEDCVGAINFPLDFALGKAQFQTGRPDQAEAVRRKPAMLAEGMRDKAVLPETALTHFRTAFPDGAVIELENAGHYCQEDVPEILIALIKQFVQLR
ncbi:alpha/beta fold hydrolase [Bradyrhizobium sp. CSA112]|uniref:alpha/beta fold hydrolase n=1 Tax=Bradyrhizobium sp. CSA112 TaxID=2699170 RepID=UPI0023AF7B57|nr:alpha/beta fold hydrolase [Bradyrhizobium sp. CSA112]MDE5451693.1 alpha/beta fold hydrolase [Bradyrhizobium sp. CSA112]